jgi:hypothetical protein
VQPNPTRHHETSLPISDTHGVRKYRLDFEAGALPPLYDYWSVSIYRAPSYAIWSECYSVGDWCEALVHGTDGSLSLYLQHTPPPASGTSNWIPTPSGPYRVELRIYEIPAGRGGTVHTFTLSSFEGDSLGVVRSLRANALTRWGFFEGQQKNAVHFSVQGHAPV